jgi:hypothetical protein
MPVALARLCAAALATALLLPAAGSAQAPAPVPIAPADGARATAGAALSFRGRGAQGDLVVALSRSPVPVGACGEIGGEGGRLPGVPTAGDPTLLQFSAPAGLPAGTWFWQVRSPSACAASAPLRLVVAAPLPALSREPIPRSIGTTNHATIVMAFGRRSPGVGRARLEMLVRNSARRWRLRVRGPVGSVPVLGDGRSEVGFSGALVAARALGTTIIQRHRVVRVRRICSPSACRTIRTRLRAFVTERDLALRPGIAWQPGPAHPSRRQYDLETVILHELGHVAGNLRHTGVGCHDTPMVRALDRGEWWRSTSDFHYRDCGAAARRAFTVRVVDSVTTTRAPTLRVGGAPGEARGRSGWRRNETT